MVPIQCITKTKWGQAGFPFRRKSPTHISHPGFLNMVIFKTPLGKEDNPAESNNNITLEWSPAQSLSPKLAITLVPAKSDLNTAWESNFEPAQHNPLVITAALPPDHSAQYVQEYNLFNHVGTSQEATQNFGAINPSNVYGIYAPQTWSTSQPAGTPLEQPTSITRKRPRTGRGGRFQCPGCRNDKKGDECDKDDNDPQSSCSACKKKDRPCGPRTLPEKRMRGFHSNIRKKNFKSIVKWMKPQTKKEKELLLKRLQLDPGDEERLSSELMNEISSDDVANHNDMYSFNQQNLEHQPNFDPGAGNPTSNYSNSNAPQLPWNYSVNQTQLLPFQPLPTTAVSGNDHQAPQRSSSVNTFSRSPPQRAETLPNDQGFQYDAPLADNEPTPLDENYPSTMTDESLASVMAKMVATQFPLIGQSRLQEIFSRTLEDVTVENQQQALQSYLQDIQPQILQEDQYNSPAFDYQYFSGPNHGFTDEENDNV